MEIKGIKNCRLVANKTQKDCADALNVSLVTFASYEKDDGTNKISLFDAFALAHFLKCDVNDFEA